MPDNSFGKPLRLLNSKDFKRVFDTNIWRASHKHLLILSGPNELDGPRLGLVIAKKHVKLAVGRNRIKRLIRESFRLNQDKLPNADFVVLIRAGVGELDNPTVVELLERSWRKISHKANNNKEAQ